MMPDDAMLLRRYAETRAEDALAELVRRHLDGVYSAALRRVGGDTHLAQDVAQQVFIALERKARALSRHPVLTSWLYTATRHEAANVVRTERRRKAREQEAQAMQEMFSDTEAARDWSRVAPVLDAAIDELSETDRTAVLLRFIDRRGFADIGATLRVSTDAARMRVERALEKLRVSLERRGVRSTSAALALALGSHAVGAAPPAAAASILASALAHGSAIAGTGSLMETVGFMSTTKWLAGTLALVATLGTATYQWTEKAAAERELSTAQRKHAERRATWETARLRAETTHRDSTGQTQRSAEAQVESGKQADFAKSRPPAPAWDPVAQGHEFMQRHPVVRTALNDYVHANLKFRYGPLFHELGLTPAQVDQFVEIWGGTIGMGARTAEGDVSLHLDPKGSNPAEARVAPSLAERTRALLGEEGLKRYQAFNEVRAGRELAAEVASSLYFTDTPLTPQQAEKLTRLAAESRKREPGSSRAERDWDGLLARAVEFLAPAQLEVLAGRRAGERFQQVLNRPRSENSKADPAKRGGG